jgi:radical SAM superfamily enzyme YgiQ (UPF0313 family)
MVVLYNPPSSPSRKPHVPLSLLALGALLEGRHEYRIIDGNLVDDPLEVLSGLASQGELDVLGVTVMPGPQLNSAAPLCRELKQRHPGLVIVWGGYFPSQHHQACLESGYVDYVLRGCAEHGLAELLAVLDSHGDVSGIAGLAFRDPQSQNVIANPMAAIPDPDQLPDYPYHRIEAERYVRATFMGERTFAHHSSYGCPFACDFCAVAAIAQGQWRAQSAAHLAGVVQALVDRLAIDSLELHDNSFFIDERRAAEFAERVAPLDIGWWAEARIDRLADYSEQTWKLLQASGLRMVFMGAESGSDETLARMRKGGSASTAMTLELVRKMEGYGVIPELSFVLGNPPDPEADIRGTLEYIRRVKQANAATEIILYLYTPVAADGELWKLAEDQGFRFPRTLDEWTGPQWRRFSERRDLRVPWLQPGLIRLVRNFEVVLNAYHPTTTDPRLGRGLRLILRALSGWRYRFGCYAMPLELRLLQRLVAYQRPETSGL